MGNEKTEKPEHFDIVVVGGGIAAATVVKTVIEQAAKKRKHPRVLILEAGQATAMSADKYDTHVEAYHRALAKVPNSPYPASGAAPQPDVLDIRNTRKPDGTAVTSEVGYFVQKGPMPFASDYTRSLGGTTLHWLGTCLRMLPHDFEMRTKYNRGVDWPKNLRYEQLKPYYERAEWDIIGVAANVRSQHYPITDKNELKKYFAPHDTARFGAEYTFPMEEIPSSYLDQYIEAMTKDLVIELRDRQNKTHRFDIKISNTPVARNSTPATTAAPQKAYVPVGAVGNADQGTRCEGNSSCIPICPAQAKYNALKTLYELIRKYPDHWRKGEEHGSRARVVIRSQCVVTRVNPTRKEAGTPQVASLSYRAYHSDGIAEPEKKVTAGVYVLAANAIENATLLLASKVANSSDQVGRNLMDHPLLLTWGMLQDNVGAYRGPGSTSGIPAFRDGSFRSERTAFRVEIGNWGWNFPENAPYDTVHDLVGGKDGKAQLYGKKLRKRLGEILPRQVRIAWELEQDPVSTNRVTVDDTYLDRLGKHRPVIEYALSDYVKASLPWAAEASKQLFTRLGMEKSQKRPTYDTGDYTCDKEDDACWVKWDNKRYWVRGAGHVVGTHRMGDDSTTSVVDSYQKSHDLDNLYIVGCGSMPTLGTSNPTLTMTALAIRTGDKIAEKLTVEGGK